MCDYVHLNPARARLLKAEQPLREYAWSSWPEYLKRPTKRWPWLRVDRLLGEYRIPQDSAAGREHLEQCVEQRRAGEDGAEYKSLRRGWCLGDETFRKELLASVSAGAAEPVRADARRETAEEKARRAHLDTAPESVAAMRPNTNSRGWNPRRG